MEVEVARTKAITAVRRDRGAVRELAVLEREQFERAGVFRLVLGLVIAAADQDRRVVGGRHADLVREDAAIERRSLCDFLAHRAIGVDAMHRDAARIVVGDQRKAARMIDVDMDRA